MFRHILLSCIISLPSLSFLACDTEDHTGIPDQIGDWRIEVGPPGNDFYEVPAPAAGPWTAATLGFPIERRARTPRAASARRRFNTRVSPLA